MGSAKARNNVLVETIVADIFVYANIFPGGEFVNGPGRGVASRDIGEGRAEEGAEGRRREHRSRRRFRALVLRG